MRPRSGVLACCFVGLLLPAVVRAQEPPPGPYYLAAYPSGKLAGAEDVLYWSKDTFGLKPVISAYHATFFKTPRGALIANKLLGAAHYFNASLEIMAGMPASDGKGLYHLSLYHTRIDPPTGTLSGVLMSKVRDGVETGVRENLKTARERLAAGR